MKNWKSLIVLILIIPMIMLVGCNDESRSTKNLVQEYNTQIAEHSATMNASSVEDNIGSNVFPIKHFTMKASSNIMSLFSTSPQYMFVSQLYEPFIKNTLLPAYAFAGVVSTKNVSKNYNKKLYAALDDVFESSNSVSNELSLLARSYEMNDDALSISNLSHLTNVLNAYEKLSLSALNFSKTVIDGYNAYVYTQPNFDGMVFDNTLACNEAMKALQYEAYVTRYFVMDAYFYCNIAGGNITKNMMGLGAEVINTFPLSSIFNYYTKSNFGYTTTPNVSKMTSNSTKLSADLKTLIVSKATFDIDYNAFSKAKTLVSNQDIVNEDNYDEKSTIIYYTHTSLAERQSLLAGIINLCV